MVRSGVCTSSPPSTFFEVGLVAIDRLRIERHDAPIFILAQERDHIVRKRGTDQHLGKQFIYGARELHVPRAIGDDDTAEGRVRIGRERLVPCLFQRIGDANSAGSVVLQYRDDRAPLVLEFEHQVHRRADVDDVVEREFLAVKLMRDLEEVAVERARLMWILAVAQRLFTLERKIEGLAEGRPSASPLCVPR